MDVDVVKGSFRAWTKIRVQRLITWSVQMPSRDAEDQAILILPTATTYRTRFNNRIQDTLLVWLLVGYFTYASNRDADDCTSHYYWQLLSKHRDYLAGLVRRTGIDKRFKWEEGKTPYWDSQKSHRWRNNKVESRWRTCFCRKNERILPNSCSFELANRPNWFEPHRPASDWPQGHGGQ